MFWEIILFTFFTILNIILARNQNIWHNVHITINLLEQYVDLGTVKNNFHTYHSKQEWLNSENSYWFVMFTVSMLYVLR